MLIVLIQRHLGHMGLDKQMMQYHASTETSSALLFNEMIWL